VREHHAFGGRIVIAPLFVFPYTAILPRDSPDCAATRDQGVDAHQPVA
jgi:hypothetical protein